MLALSESMVNRLNERLQQDGLRVAREELERAEARLTAAQLAMTESRERERAVDPTRSAVVAVENIGRLEGALAQARAEMGEASRFARGDNPRVMQLRNRIEALSAQVAEERKRTSANESGLSQQVGEFERLALDRELARAQLSSATASLEKARVDAQRQQLFLLRIVEPNLAEYARYPKAMLTVLYLFLSSPSPMAWPGCWSPGCANMPRNPAARGALLATALLLGLPAAAQTPLQNLQALQQQQLLNQSAAGLAASRPPPPAQAGAAVQTLQGLLRSDRVVSRPGEVTESEGGPIAMGPLGDGQRAGGATAVFGASLFTREATAVSDAPNPNYVITPGDRVSLRVWGAVEAEALGVVDPSGNLFLPNIGPIRIAGTRAGDLQRVVEAEVQKIYTSQVQVYAVLLSTQRIGVFVTGFVRTPAASAARRRTA
ncbi:polysaccharide biosynthesis/export family protein [Paeniroseomonas aquatica]|uniref:polysaccharide biosynthesis/export family protein n=1 Tax=Paeniroseomonas aquatica TaxID=373043 RepID=UPI00360848EC